MNNSIFNSQNTSMGCQLQVGVVILKSARFWIVLLPNTLGLPPWTLALASLTLTFCIFEVTAGHISDGVYSCSVGPCQSFQ